MSKPTEVDRDFALLRARDIIPDLKTGRTKLRRAVEGLHDQVEMMHASGIDDMTQSRRALRRLDALLDEVDSMLFFIRDDFQRREHPSDDQFPPKKL